MTEKKKFEVPTGAVYALVAAVSLICITVLAVALAGDNGGGQEREIRTGEKLSRLVVEDVYFRDPGSSSTSMEVTVYLTNDGTRDARDVEAHIWPIMKGSNIATDTEEIEFGDILINETMVGTKQIDLEAGTLHSVEILVFDSGKMVVKGEASISTGEDGGSRYSNVDIKGTAADSDYDGMSDSWEEYYGLDPRDPSDAYRDRDGDGVNNYDEYRAGSEPVEEYESGTGLLGSSDSQEDSTMAIGAGLFLLLVTGVIGILIAGAVISHRRRVSAEPVREDIPDSDPVPASGDQRGFRTIIGENNRNGPGTEREYMREEA